jgi:hypothetical protein
MDSRAEDSQSFAPIGVGLGKLDWGFYNTAR